MYKKLVYLIMTVLLLSSLTFCLPIMKTIRAVPTEIIVPDDYPTIQEAIDNASAGDTIRVKPETYHEHILINKSVKIIGKNPLNTIIDGDETESVIRIVSPDVSIMGFTIQNGYFGIELHGSNGSIIVGNKIMNNSDVGIFIRNSSNNEIRYNTIANNSMGVWITSELSLLNTFYHNNFIDNPIQVQDFSLTTKWDNGAEGNYWSDYEGKDLDGDGIGDTLLPHYPTGMGVVDYYPLIEPWSLIRVFDVYQKGEHHYVTTCCNSTVASFIFNQPKKLISFNVTGPPNKNGFCNATIPNALLWGNFTVLVDEESPLELIQSFNATHNSFYFTYPLANTSKVKIMGTEAISNEPPIVDFAYSPLNPTIDDSINFTDNSIDPDGTIIRWYWDFGDGNYSTRQNLTHRYGKKGFYTVSLTVTDNVQASNTISKTVVVGKFRTELTLNVPSTATVKETIVVTAFLKDENYDPISDETIDFYFYENGEWKPLDSASTNASGLASVTYTPVIWGEHQIMANYTGSAIYFENRTTATLMVNPLVVTLTIDAPDPLKVTLGKTITITAILKDENGVPIPNATIEFYLFEDGTWELVGSRETDSDGVAVLEYTPPTAGTFYIKAEFPGTEIYGKTSDEIKLNVRFDYTPHIVAGVIATAVIGIVAFTVWRKRKKTSKSKPSQK